MLSILMPVYNERERVERAIAEVLATELPAEFELIIVDDGSTDGTREILRDGDWDGRVRLFEHDAQPGQGRGHPDRADPRPGRVRRRSSTPTSSTTRPTSGLLMPPLLDGRANACFGVRAFDGYTSHSFLFVLGNKGVTLACNVLFNVYLHDIMTCHKMIRTDLFRSLPLRSPGFAIEPEITARLVQRGERIFEVPVHYRARATEEGKKLTAIDGFRVIAHAVALPLSPLTDAISGPSPQDAGRCALTAPRSAAPIWTVDASRSTGSSRSNKWRRVAVLVDLALLDPRRVAERVAAGPAGARGEVCSANHIAPEM